jgi:signal transduction histidine kinase
VSLRTWLRRHGDRLLAIALVIGVWLETTGIGVSRDDEPIAASPPAAGVALLAGVLLAASLAWRQRAPLLPLVLAIVVASVALAEPLDGPVTVVVAMMVATYSVGAHTRDRSAIAGVAGLAVLLAIAVARELTDEFEVADAALPVLVLGGPWLAGLALRSRRERETVLEQARLDHATTAVAEERARIARELHDAVAHSIGVVVLQARGARRTMTVDPAAAIEALDAIESTGTQALVEMRRLVGVLRQPDDGVDLSPPPSLRHLDAMVDQVRAAGLPVELTIEGTPIALAPGVDLSAYRIVQEALTNALAHAGPATATVRVRYGEDHLALEIADTGTGVRQPDPAGHGLIGMRERVSLYQGRLETDVRPGGGFVIRARLPLTTTSP